MTLSFNADSDTDGEPDPADPSLLFVQLNGIDGSPERQSLSQGHTAKGCGVSLQ
jgi:hypothetical protein